HSPLVSTAPPAPPISTLSLHDALPISDRVRPHRTPPQADRPPAPLRPLAARRLATGPLRRARHRAGGDLPDGTRGSAASPDRDRSEEHTSELQSRFELVCRLLLEKKKI